MAFRTILLFVAFVTACGGAVFLPMLGVVGYMTHYHIWPERQWWGQPLAAMGIRVSLCLAGALALGVALQWRRLMPGGLRLCAVEWLMIVFVGMVWLSEFVTAASPGSPDDLTGMPPAMKLLKMLIFLLLLTHVVTNLRRLEVLIWTIIAGVLYLGVVSYQAGESAFARGGRLNNIGGPDFCEANGLAAYMAACLPLIAMQFMRASKKGKLVCLFAAVLAVNTVILTRSRGAFVGLLAGALVALLAAPKGKRLPALVGVAVMVAGILLLTDRAFWNRMETISAPTTQDESSQSRLEIWQGSLAMLEANPWGVGAGNFQSRIGSYAPRHPNRDAHNTYVLCYSELGIQGIAAYVLLLIATGALLWRVLRQARNQPLDLQRKNLWLPYGVGVAVAVVLGNGLTSSHLYTESSWWFLALPVCLMRALESAAAPEPDASVVGRERGGRLRKTSLRKSRRRASCPTAG